LNPGIGDRAPGESFSSNPAPRIISSRVSPHGKSARNQLTNERWEKSNKSTNNTRFTMKSIIVSFLSLAALAFSPSCTFVESKQPTTHTTRTTTSEIAPTVYGTTETKTTRTY